MAESCINEAERESAKVYERLQGCERQIDGLTAMMTSQSEQITIKEEVIKYLQREKQRTQRAWLRNEIRYKTAMRAMLVQDVVSAARARQSRLWYQSVVRRSLTAETLSGAEQDDMAPFGQMLSQGDVGLTDIALHDSGTALLKCVAGLQESSPKRVSREWELLGSTVSGIALRNFSWTWVVHKRSTLNGTDNSWRQTYWTPFGSASIRKVLDRDESPQIFVPASELVRAKLVRHVEHHVIWIWLDELSNPSDSLISFHKCQEPSRLAP
jgi:hypothetical protein